MDNFKLGIFIEFVAMFVTGLAHLVVGQAFPLTLYPITFCIVLLSILLVLFVIAPVGNWFLHFSIHKRDTINSKQAMNWIIKIVTNGNTYNTVRMTAKEIVWVNHRHIIVDDIDWCLPKIEGLSFERVETEDKYSWVNGI